MLHYYVIDRERKADMKHAFLLLAHNKYNQLSTLIRLLDNERIDIYLHIDKRSPKYVVPQTHYSKIFQIPSIRTNWGGYSLVECELRLLEEALKNEEYTFIHLLSGQDLPIKPIDEILSYFDSHKQFNFVFFNKPEGSKDNCDRVKYYYPFQDIKPRGRSFWSISQRIFVCIQKLFRIDRTKRYEGTFKSGSQWWSIKTGLARYIVSERPLIYKLFKYTMCDEMFVQTLVYNSEYYNTLFIKEEFDQHSNQRKIEFINGRPHVWTMDDIDEIKNSDLLFCRKFDEMIDSEIIDEIVKMVEI